MIESIIEFFSQFKHLDIFLKDLIDNYGTATYAILFLIIFVETGLVIMPFLPGDSLLFTAGMFAAFGNLNIFIVIALLIFAAVLGDNTNYWIGKYIGDHVSKLKLFGKQLVKEDYIKKTEQFYEKYGVKTIIMARFVPIVRTFAPFVAGVGEMNYKRFFVYDIIGGILWVSSCTTAGYLLCNNPFVKQHFEIVVLGIIGISVLPMIIGFLVSKFKKQT